MIWQIKYTIKILADLFKKGNDVNHDFFNRQTVGISIATADAIIKLQRLKVMQ